MRSKDHRAAERKIMHRAHILKRMKHSIGVFSRKAAAFLGMMRVEHPVGLHSDAFRADHARRHVFKHRAALRLAPSSSPPAETPARPPYCAASTQQTASNSSSILSRFRQGSNHIGRHAVATASLTPSRLSIHQIFPRARLQRNALDIFTSSRTPSIRRSRFPISFPAHNARPCIPPIRGS